MFANRLLLQRLIFLSCGYCLMAMGTLYGSEELSLEIQQVYHSPEMISQVVFARDGSYLAINSSPLGLWANSQHTIRVLGVPRLDSLATFQEKAIPPGQRGSFWVPCCVTQQNELIIVERKYKVPLKNGKPPRTTALTRYIWRPGHPVVQTEHTVPFTGFYSPNLKYMVRINHETPGRVDGGLFRYNFETGVDEFFPEIAALPYCSVEHIGDNDFLLSRVDGNHNLNISRHPMDDVTRTLWAVTLGSDTISGDGRKWSHWTGMFSMDGAVIQIYESLERNAEACPPDKGQVTLRRYIFLSGHDGSLLYTTAHSEEDADKDMPENEEWGYVGHCYFEGFRDPLFRDVYRLTIHDPEAKRTYRVDTAELGTVIEEQYYKFTESPDGETLAIVKHNAPNKGESLLILAKLTPKSRPLSPRLPERRPNPQTTLPPPLQK